MDNPEKLAIQGTEDGEKHMCWTPLYANTNNINKTWTLLQTTGGKIRCTTSF